MTTIFSRVVVGVDGSPESLGAARLAALLEAPGGTLTLVAAWTLAPPLVTPMMTLPAYDTEERAAEREAEEVLRVANEQLPAARTMMIHASPAQALIDEIKRAQSTLVAVGAHGRGRAAGILLGSTTTSLVHDAPCSVLVTRERPVGPPRSIAVGVDGSTPSAAAYTAARYLADRFRSELTVVVAEGDKPLDLAAVSLIAGDGLHVIPEKPVPALAAASADVDLLVLGSRGLHGLKSLGSVSERVAHRASCSTLLVRAT